MEAGTKLGPHPMASGPSLLLVALAASVLVSSGFGRPSQDRPNIVLLFVDDAGYADFGFQGSADHATPHIDSIATQGVRFTQAYVTASVCSPSRAGLLTGRYQQRFGHEYNLPGQDDPELPASRRGLPLDETTIADVMRSAGYATGIVGKWHLGRHPRFRPLRRGFDEFFGMVRGGSPYLAGTATGIFEGEEEVAADSIPYLTDAFGDRAVEFIEQHRDEPFFLFVSFNAPHTPMEPRAGDLERVRGSFETDERAANVAMTSALDDNVGKILAALEKHGLGANTLVVFTNDNGGAMPYNGSLNAPLRGTKGTVLEGGNRVPMSIRWPVRWPAGTLYELPVSTLDFLPTFAAAGRADTAGLSLDGVDLLPFIDGDRPGHAHDALYWKLNWGAAIRRSDWKLVRTPADEYWLFNLSPDPGERNDLSAELPDRVAALRAELEEWESSLPPPIWTSAAMWREHSLLRYDQSVVDTYRRR